MGRIFEKKGMACYRTFPSSLHSSASLNTFNSSILTLCPLPNPIEAHNPFRNFPGEPKQEQPLGVGKRPNATDVFQRQISCF